MGVGELIIIAFLLGGLAAVVGMAVYLVVTKNKPGR